MKKVLILGATGSIGTTCLNSIKEKNLPIEIVGLAAKSNQEKLETLAHKFNVKQLYLSDKKINNTDFNYSSSLDEFLDKIDCDIVLNGIAGFSGLDATVKVLERKIDIALANKESVVTGGSFIFDLAKKNNCKINPVDSEHSALKALIDAQGKEHVHSLIITASGGPFRTLDKNEFKNITVEKALNHPTWKMGRKITIDSSTLANKALEVIEASFLFGFEPSQIEVSVHPQSIVHSMIRLKDGAIYAQLGTPNMSLPIIEGILGTYDYNTLVKPLSFDNLTLTFEKPDYNRFPLLQAAYSILELKKGYPIAFNGANEVAVEAFLNRQISYLQLQDCVMDVLEKDFSIEAKNLQQVIEIDNKSRLLATRFIKNLGK